MDDREAHFFVSVGRLCADARIGGLIVRLSLGNGEQVVGVPDPLRETDASDELDTTGYADEVTVDGTTVRLSDIVDASLRRPESI